MAIHFVTNRSGAVRRESINGRSVLIAPVVMLTEGVHEGSKGPLLYPADELAKNVESWNGVPVTLNHPKKNSRPVSAKHSPQTMVGVVMNARWDAVAKKLRAEVYIDEQRLRSIAPTLQRRIASGGSVEVSTGLFTDDAEWSGTFNGERFDAIARAYEPDHLALLPNGVGACSISKGCGLPVHNHESEKRMCRCNETLTPFGMATDRPVTNDHSGQDEDDFDITPLPTFNAEQYEAEQARKERRSPKPVVNKEDDEYDMVPPSTCPR